MGTNRISGLAFVALGMVLLFAASRWTVQDLLGDPGPKLMPRLVAVIMIVLGLLLAVSPDSEETEQPAGERGGLLVLAMAAGLALGYAALFKLLGFTLASGMYLFGAMTLLGARSARSVFIYALVAIAMSIGLGLLFKSVLGVPLPGVLL